MGRFTFVFWVGAAAWFAFFACFFGLYVIVEANNASQLYLFVSASAFALALAFAQLAFGGEAALSTDRAVRDTRQDLVAILKALERAGNDSAVAAETGKRSAKLIARLSADVDQAVARAQDLVDTNGRRVEALNLRLDGIGAVADASTESLRAIKAGTDENGVRLTDLGLMHEEMRNHLRDTKAKLDEFGQETARGLERVLARLPDDTAHNAAPPQT